MREPPLLTLMGITRGGPPTDRNWTRNGRTPTGVTESISAVPQNANRRYQDSIYESTLTVVGRQPGIYRYTATNRISPELYNMINIEGIMSQS